MGADAAIERLLELELSDSQGAAWRFADALRRGPLLIVFIRGAWCFLSRRALGGLRTEAERLASEGCQVVVVSPEPVEKLEALAKRVKAFYPLLSDPGSTAAEALGAVIERRHQCPFPAAFLIAPDGVIRFRHVGRDARDWPDWKEI
jgi:peroxiredoxin